ncbi:MAG: alpha/beta hydrolase [Bacteroidetes bacterium]|nr:alpha/beta hydrolase [Bacteroidota bacterium]
MKNKFNFICTLLLLMLSSADAQQKVSYDNNPAAGKYASINGIQLYYETYGNGKPLLMLHGNGNNISAFEKQIPFFSRYFKVIAIDSRLQGKSGGSTDTLSYQMMADDFCALIQYLKLDSVYVLGWSDGGIDAIMMAMTCGSKIKAIAVTGANTVPDSSAISNADIQSMKDVVANSQSTAKEKTLNRMMIFQPVIEWQRLASVHCPTLVMAGDHDIIKPEHTIKIFQSIPGAQLCIFPNAHHGVCQQYPELFNQTVLKFFNAVK